MGRLTDDPGGGGGESGFLLGNVDPMARLQNIIFLPPFSYQISDADFTNQIAYHHRTSN